ncbi:MAG: Rod shape-determining protein MreD [Microscillaceae bacterium]|jgi:rod shape-determining protein MreD|nr:Rod shape-determining protein MreD [Microscillaceae bacterium]
MNNLSVVGQTITFFIYIFIQVFFAKHLELFGVAFCFMYVNYLLIMPIQTDRLVMLLTAFLLGLLVDMFYDTLGIHSFACVFIAYFRPFLISFLSKEDIFALSIKETGLVWFVRYAGILLFVHHFWLFFLQQFNFSMFLATLLKVSASTLFTLLVCLMVQYMFSSSVVSDVRK